MLEIVKLLLDLVMGGQKLKELKRVAAERKNLGDLGYELFQLYQTLHSVHATGLRLVTELEQDVERLKYPDHFSKDRVLSFDTLYALRQQRFNLSSALQSVERLEPILILVSPDVVKQLHPLMSIKGSLLSIALGLYDRDGVLFARVEPSALERSLTAALDGTIHYDPTEQYEPLEIEYEDGDTVYNLYKHVDEVEVPITADNPQQYLSVIEDFLARADLRAQLDEIGHGLERLREDLLANFDKRDLLLRVGDERVVVRGPASVLDDRK